VNNTLVHNTLLQQMGESPAKLLGLSPGMVSMAEVLLSNDESSTDAELITHLQEECGFSLHQATETVKFAERYRCEIFLSGHGPLVRGHESLAYDPHTREFRSPKQPDTQESLTRELQTWCRTHDLPQESADDLARIPGLGAAERVWLEEYCKRWDAVMTALQQEADFTTSDPDLTRLLNTVATYTRGDTPGLEMAELIQRLEQRLGGIPLCNEPYLHCVKPRGHAGNHETSGGDHMPIYSWARSE
jgi:hypothetical protein